MRVFILMACVCALSACVSAPAPATSHDRAIVFNDWWGSVK